MAEHTSDHSYTTMTEIVLPTHANALGTVFGGTVLGWMDICSAICAQRHCHAVVVTAGIDDLSFEQPIRIGQVARIEARVTAAFSSSVEVEVTVSAENPMTDETWHCVRAYMTFVAIGASGKPTAVPKLVLENDTERERAAQAEERRQVRIARRKQRARA